MKLAFTFVLTFCTLSLSFAGGIRGLISTNKGEALPYASIAVKGSSNGTIANEEGVYEFSLPAGSYDLTIQYLGFKTLSKTVTVGSDFKEVNFVLEEQALNLKEANVASGKEDAAYTIMRKAIAKSRFHQLQVRSYTANVYARSTALPTKIPYLLEKRLKKEGLQEGKAILNESVSEIKYRRPNTFNQRIISTRNSLDNSIPSPNEYILASFYSPDVAGTVSPLSPKAFGFYKFEYEGYFEDRGETVNKIKVIPKAYGEGVFKGSIYILEDRWSIHSFNLQTTQRGLDINVKQLFSNVQNVWLPVNQQFMIKGGYLGFAGEFKYLVSVTYNKLDIDPKLREDIVIIDHKIEKTATDNTKRKGNLDQLIAGQKEFSTKNFRKLTKEYEKQQKKDAQNPIEGPRMVRQDSINIDSMANKRDTTYWSALRPIPLSKTEVAGYTLQDSLTVVKEAKNEKDRPDSTYFKLKHLILGNTYTFENRNSLSFDSPILALGFNTVEGYAFNLVTEYQKQWGKSYQFSLRPVGRYSFGRQRIYGTLEAAIGNRNWNFNVNGGEMVTQINQARPILPFINSLATRFFERNLIKLYKKQFIKAQFNRQNIFDVFSFSTGIEFERRTELYNLDHIKPVLFWDRFAYTPNRPVNRELSDTGFPVNDALIFDFSLSVRPWQRYVLRNGQKRYLRNRNPIFSLNYKTGLAFGGDVDFQYLQGSIRQNISLGPRIDFDYVASGGGFLSARKLYFTDYKHFMGGEFFILTGSPLSDFRMLPYYMHSTSSWFYQGHAMFSLQRFAVTRIPVLRLTGIKETLQVHYLSVPTLKNYTELVYGIDNIIRLVRVELVGHFHGADFKGFGYRIGTSFRIGNGRR